MRQKIITLLQKHGELLFPKRESDIPSGRPYVYAVINGEDLLQLGMSKEKKGRGRLGKVMRGTTAKKHNKAYICALGEALSNVPNEYFLVAFHPGEEKVADAVEYDILKCLGIKRNTQAATLISGIDNSSIESVHRGLWERYKVSPQYKALGEVERMLAEELFDLVTYCKGYPRGSKVVQGDLLEGNILQKLGKNHLIQIFQKLTDNYFSYGVHKIPPNEYNEVIRDYSYVPTDGPFELRTVEHTRRVAEVIPIRHIADKQPEVDVLSANDNNQGQEAQSASEPMPMAAGCEYIVRENSQKRFHLERFGVAIGGPNRDRVFQIVIVNSNGIELKRSAPTTARTLGIAERGRGDYDANKFHQSDLVVLNPDGSVTPHSPIGRRIPWDDDD